MEIENIIGKYKWVKHRGCSQPRTARQEGFARTSAFSLSAVSVSFPGKALRRTPILCLDPLALAHTHVITVIRSFKHLKTLILLKRSKMEELLKAMISWEREEFKSGQIEE